MTVTQTSVALDDAQRVIAAGRSRAAEIDSPSNIAVVDARGNLVAYVRMDGAWIGSIDISINKEFTARALDILTEDLGPNACAGEQLYGIDALQRRAHHDLRRRCAIAARRPDRRGGRREWQHRRARESRRRGGRKSDVSNPTVIVPPMSDAEYREFVTAGTRTVKWATIRRDGRPHVVSAWFVLEDDDLLITTGFTSVKGRAVLRDPRVGLCIDDDRPPYAFVMIAGRANVSTDPDEVLRAATLNAPPLCRGGAGT